jgi:hypothetical protein
MYAAGRTRTLAQVARGGDLELLAKEVGGIREIIADMESHTGVGPSPGVSRPASVPDVGFDPLTVLYARGLALAERAYELSGDRIEGRVGPGRYVSCDSSTGESRTYIVVESSDAGAVAPAFEETLRRPEAQVVTDGALKLLLVGEYAKEAFALRRLNPSIGLAPPADSVMVRYWLWRLRPHLLRTPTILSRDPEAMCRMVAEARLYAERGITVTSPDEVRNLYVEAFGSWPFAGDRSVQSFYKGDYFTMWGIVDRALAAFRRGPAGPVLRLGDDDDCFWHFAPARVVHTKGRP